MIPIKIIIDFAKLKGCKSIKISDYRGHSIRTAILESVELLEGYFVGLE